MRYNKIRLPIVPAGSSDDDWWYPECYEIEALATLFQGIDEYEAVLDAAHQNEPSRRAASDAIRPLVIASMVDEWEREHQPTYANTVAALELYRRVGVTFQVIDDDGHHVNFLG